MIGEKSPNFALSIISKPKTLLVPLDGSNYAEQAIEAATALARLLEVKVGGYQVNVSDQRVDWSVV